VDLRDEVARVIARLRADSGTREGARSWVRDPDTPMAPSTGHAAGARVRAPWLLSEVHELWEALPKSIARSPSSSGGEGSAAWRSPLMDRLVLDASIRGSAGPGWSSGPTCGRELREPLPGEIVEAHRASSRRCRPRSREPRVDGHAVAGVAGCATTVVHRGHLGGGPFRARQRLGAASERVEQRVIALGVPRSPP
jgi:hypothetical protein